MASSLHFLVVIAFLFIIGCNHKSNVCESDVNKKNIDHEYLGGGFIKCSYQVINDSSHFEKYYLSSETFYHSKNLGGLSAFYKSPRRDYAIFVKNEDAQLYVFDLESGEEKIVDFDVAIFPVEVKWSQNSKHVVVHYRNDDKFLVTKTVRIDLSTGDAEK
ncbi:MAG: hypothetical protein OCC49_01130 [Fibrobacterales bacterium]